MFFFRRHLKKLAEEAEEMARIHGGEARTLAAKEALEIASKATSQTRRDGGGSPVVW